MKTIFVALWLLLAIPAAFAQADTSDLYEKKDKTFASVLTDFKDKVANAPVVAAAIGFLHVTSLAGSCPSMSVMVPIIDAAIDISDFICNSAIGAAFTVAGVAVLVSGAYFAVKVAFL